MNDKKGEKEQFNKVAELISKTSLNINFGLDLAKLRARFCINPAGFESDNERNHWYSNLSSEEASEYWEDIYNLFMKYSLPVSSRWLIDYYVCRNKILPFSAKTLNRTICELDYETIVNMGETSTAIRWKNGHQPFITLYISDLASKEDIKKFIDGNWEVMRDYMSLQWTGKPRIIRPIKDENRKIHEQIYYLSRQPKKMLSAQSNNSKTYKEEIISDIINEKYGRKYSFDNIKQIIARQTRLRKGDISSDK
jgi:hypothetical protein